MTSLSSALLLEEVSIEALEKFRDSFQHVQSMTLEQQQKLEASVEGGVTAIGNKPKSKWLCWKPAEL